MKVLILSAATGGGHKQASKALADIFAKKNPDVEVRIEDALAYCGHFFDKTITGGYHFLATKTPHLYGKFYRITDRKTNLNSVVGIVNNKMSKKLFPLFEKFKPDIVVSCHPFVTEMVAKLKETKLVTIPLVAIITDFAPHRTYVRDNVDVYVVADDEMIGTLKTKYGVPEEKIYSLGIPINPSFYQPRDKEKIMNSINFSSKIPTILIMAGSFGVTDILKIYENMIKIENDFQIIVITGKNKRLYEAFEKLLNNPQKQLKPTKLFFFINNVGDYMAVSDLIITKPGGLTVSESLASFLPLLIFDAIPGQETDNAEYLVKNNMAIKLSKGIHGTEQIKYLLDNPDLLEQMRESCRKHFKDKSAEHVCDLINEISQKSLSYNNK